MIELKNLLIFLYFILPSILSQKPISCDRSCPGPAIDSIKYPTHSGFSPGCEIQLNCTSKGTVLIGEFLVEQINSDELLINLPTKCGRTFDSINHLFSDHYAPTTANAILMENCTKQIMNCLIPETMVERLDINLNCNRSHDGFGNVTCYYGDNTRMFLDYGNMTRIGCQFLFTGIVSETTGDNHAVSLDFQLVNLGWWVKGACDCSSDADSTEIVSSVDGSDGHRCKCKPGFDGNGYKASSSCRKLKEPRGAALKLKIGFSCGIAVVMLLLFVILCRKKKLWETPPLLQHGMFHFLLGTTRNHQIEMFIKNYGTLAPKRYNYSEIKKKLTNSFQEKLGQGGYGSVYKGQSPDGEPVAVKLLTGPLEDGEDFINEVASIGRTSHVNIVTLLGFFIEGKKRALMYEFMPNGSLDKFLRGGSARLDWNTLFLITKEIARGLEYLHRGCNTRIVHFDIKPHNILLDEDFLPKISDFGLAKLCKRKESIVSVMGARGTAGYMGPEVFFRSLGGASHKSDVYSYGMMVLEMTGAHKNINVNATSTSEAYFPDWIYKQVETRGNLGDYGVSTEEEEELAMKMITVSLWCIQSDPSDQPSISKALEMLEGSFESLQVPPRRFWSSSRRPAQGTSPIATQSSTNERLLTVQDIGEDFSS